MLADGAIFEWETDTYADPKAAPGTFLIAYLSATQEGLDKANKAVQETLKSHPMRGPAFESLVDVAASSDVVVRSYAAYK
jgi:prephenate dehydrogenase